MEFRILDEQDLIQASGLSRYVFDNCLRNRMEYPKTIAYIEDYLKEENLTNMHREGALTVWGAFENDQMIGVSGLQSNGLITMLYVLPQFAGKGGGKGLLRVMQNYAKAVYSMNRVTVNATPAQTANYFSNRGFEFIGSHRNMHAPFISMYADYEKLDLHTKRAVSWKVILLAILGCFLFATIFCCVFMANYITSF